MKKLIRGIIDFRKNILPSRRELFARLATGQAPDVLFITCSDSRVAPNWFASTDPGDLFVVRNVGNMVPSGNPTRPSSSDHSVAAAIEFAVNTLNVTDIVVCGHSGCGAMIAIKNGMDKLQAPHLQKWLESANVALQRPSDKLEPRPDLPKEDELSQRSVLQQIENLKTYSNICEKVEAGKLRLHAWWFSIAEGGVFVYDAPSKRFVLIDSQFGENLLKQLS